MQGTRELRSIERAIRFMESVDESCEILPELKQGAYDLRESIELGDGPGVDMAIEEMRQAMSNYMGMEYMDGEDAEDMDMAMKSMKSAMKSMKGNAPSHDYSQDDGEYEMAMDGEDDEMEESREEYIAYLEGQLEEHREALRTVTSAYITAKGLNRVPRARQAEFMESIQEYGHRPGDFDTLTMFEDYFEDEVSSFLGEGLNESAPVHGHTPAVADVNPLLAEDSSLFQNIQYLSGKLS